MPQVAIIIPVHNTAAYLKHCVESVRNQTLKDIEIILVDNLSSDGSAQICDDYALMDSRIKNTSFNCCWPFCCKKCWHCCQCSSLYWFC